MYIEVGTIEGGASDLRIYRTACMHSYMKACTHVCMYVYVYVYSYVYAYE